MGGPCVVSLYHILLVAHRGPEVTLQAPGPPPIL
jgi:hypothetical protein